MTRSECDISKPFFKSETDPYAHIERQIESLGSSGFILNRNQLDEIADTLRDLLAVARAAQWLTIHVPTGHIAGLTEQSKYIGLKEALAKLTDSQPTEK